LKLAGELAAAADLLQRGIELADALPDDAFADYGEHPGMICRAFAGWVRSLMGFLDDAARLAEEAIDHARRRKDPHGLAFALVSSGLVYVIQRGPARAHEIGTEVIALAREHHLPQWLGLGHEIKGWATVQQGDASQGILLQEEGLRHLLATGARTHLSRMLADLAESYLIAGQPAMARHHLTAASAHRDRHGEHYYAAELCRLHARLLELEGADTKDVERAFLDALETAHGAGATLLELRAATDLARFRVSHGEHGTARDVLSSVYGSLTEGFGWPDAIDARALLED
jgi:predicted ATPase